MSKRTHQRIKSVLEKFEEFDLQYPNGTEEDFAYWLLNKESTEDVENEHKNVPTGEQTAAYLNKSIEEVKEFYPLEITANILMTKFWRVLRNRLKVALTPLGLGNVDDFSYLASMFQLKNPTKTELILAHLQEITTGTEIIKRLVNNGWLKETPHPTDKRSKIILLTEEGRIHVQKAFEVAMPISIDAYKMLNKEQLLTLYELLKTIEQENTEPYYTLKKEIGKN